MRQVISMNSPTNLSCLPALLVDVTLSVGENSLMKQSLNSDKDLVKGMFTQAVCQILEQISKEPVNVVISLSISEIPGLDNRVADALISPDMGTAH